jgi:hypothetical protein
LPELEGAAGDAVLLHRFIDALPEELQVHAYGIRGDYDHLVASLSRIQKTLGKKEKQGVTWRYRRAELVNEILKGACGYDDLSVEEVVQAIQDFKGGRAGGERGDGWRGGGGSGRDAAAVSSYTRSGETTAASIEAFVIDSSAPLGHRTNPVGPDPSVPMERQFYSTTRNSARSKADSLSPISTMKYTQLAHALALKTYLLNTALSHSAYRSLVTFGLPQPYPARRI